MIISMAGRDNHQRRFGKRGDFPKEIFPRVWRQVAFTNNEIDLTIVQQSYCSWKSSRMVKQPFGGLQNLGQSRMVVCTRAEGENPDSLVQDVSPTQRGAGEVRAPTQMSLCYLFQASNHTIA